MSLEGDLRFSSGSALMGEMPPTPTAHHLLAAMIIARASSTRVLGKAWIVTECLFTSSREEKNYSGFIFHKEGKKERKKEKNPP